MGDAARKYAVRGARSPGGAKTIERRGSVLLLHRAGQEPVTLGADFHIGPGPADCVAANRRHAIESPAVGMVPR